MADHDQPKPHAIFIPYPLQGHVIPSVNLAIKLATLGFTVTFINTESVHHHTARAHPAAAENPFAAAPAAGLDIRYRTVSDGLPVEFDRSLNHDQFMASLLHVFSAHVEAAVAEIVAAEEPPPPASCLIADTFFVWPSKVAKKFGLVNVSYWTEPALVFSLYYHIDLLMKNGHFACQDIRDDPIDYVPGVSPIEPNDVMSYLQDRETTSVVHQIIFKAFNDVKSSDFVLCNTVEELEPETIRALQATKPFYSIGPVFPARFSRSPVATSLWPESDCAEWLDSRPHGSVLYVSFGSYAHVAGRDLLEIAQGLSMSNVSFVWVLRPNIVSSGGADPLPEGFRGSVRDRAVIVPWCCQAAVLAHPAVGGFLTHCGWNSILESVWCQVPLLCFPLLTDQFTNRKLVVSDWRIGIGLRNQGLVTRDEVAHKIDSLMCGKSGLDYRKAIQQVKITLDIASSPSGSSVKNMHQFVNDLKTRMVIN